MKQKIKNFSKNTQNFSKNKQTTKVIHGIVHILTTFNNTIVTITKINGDSISSASAGSSGFRGSRKGTAFAGQIVAEQAARKALQKGIKRVEIFIIGQGLGRETSIRSIKESGMNVRVIHDVTPISFNGCRPPKRRRV